MDRQIGHLTKNPQDAVHSLVWVKKKVKEAAVSIPGVLAIGAHLAFLQRDSGYASVYRPSEQQSSGPSLLYLFLFGEVRQSKVVGIGNTGTGKTCLIKHFCESKFSGGYQPTVGVDYGFKIQNVKGLELRVHLWDLSGSPEYIDVRNELYGQTDAVFLVFDVTNQASFESLDTWLKEINKYSGGVQEVVLVANKVDTKSGKRLISTQDAKKWAINRKVNLYEVSAATGEGVNVLFDELLSNVVQRRKAAGLLPQTL